MSIKQVLVSIEESALAELKKIGGVVVHAVMSEGQVFVAKLRDEPVGAAAMNTIELLEESGKSGSEKFAELTAKQGPALVKAVEDMGGLKGVFSSVEALGNEFFNTLVNDFKSAIGK